MEKSQVYEGDTDAAGSEETIYRIAPGETFFGTLHKGLDTDWVEITPDKDRIYRFDYSAVYPDTSYRPTVEIFAYLPESGVSGRYTDITLWSERDGETMRGHEIDLDSFNAFLDTEWELKVYLSISSRNAKLASDYTLSYQALGRYYYLGAGDHELTGTRLADSISAGTGHQIIHARGGDDQVTLGGRTGETPGDIVYGGAGNDDIMTGYGDDLIYGGTGKDTISGAFGNDTIRGGADFDLIYGDWGNDRLYGGGGRDFLFGDEGDDWISGGAGDDRIDGGHGTNYLAGGRGQDFIRGSGDDWLDYRMEDGLKAVRVDLARGVARSTHGEKDTLEGVENIWGSAFADRLLGSRHDNKITGGKGDDFIKARGGNDTVLGSAGNDMIYGNGGADSLSGGQGRDLLLGENGDDTLSGQGGGDRLFGGKGDDALSGDDGNDILIGDRGNDSLSGGLGADLLKGMEGDDILDGGEGNDILRGGVGDDRFLASVGDDILIGGEGTDVFDFGLVSLVTSVGVSVDLARQTATIPGAGTDRLSGIEAVIGSSGDDEIRGDGGANTIDGGEGNDHLNGGDGNDLLFGSRGDDVISGGDGDDVIGVYTGPAYRPGGPLTEADLRSGNGKDTIDGGAGDDRLYGGARSDVLHGGSGDDHINGEDGNDDLYGGDGSDVFVLSDGKDVIYDFDPRFDRISFSRTEAVWSYSRWLDVADDVVSLSGGDMVLEFGDGNSLTVLGVNFFDLADRNFIFS